MSGRPLELSPPELRVLGCLVEKERTTPDVYPLTLNALRSACNQSTNRDPVVDYDEATVRAALDRLNRRRMTRLTSHAGSRAPKYRHLLDQALKLDGAELALIGLLMLRGPQTPGELKGRAERLHHFADLEELAFTLESLCERELVQRQGRRPGQKEDRYGHLLGAAGGWSDEASAESEDAVPASTAPPTEPDQARETVEARLARLENEVARISQVVDGL